METLCRTLLEERWDSTGVPSLDEYEATKRAVLDGVERIRRGILAPADPENPDAWGLAVWDGVELIAAAFARYRG